MGHMNTQRLLHTALPFLLLALAFAALASLCVRGMPGQLEGQGLAAASQLLQGASPLNPQWGSLQASAVLLQPALALSIALLGSTQGAVASMRLVFLTLAFLEALVSYKLLLKRLGSTGSLLLSLGALLCSGCGLEMAVPYGLCVIFQLVTLPTEFNASRRARVAIERSALLSEEEQKNAKKVLTAAALTYVAALATALAQFVRLLTIVNRRRD